jgi:hypothetical protein
MKHDFEDENKKFDSAYTAKMKREMIPDGGRVHVPLYMMDGAPGRIDTRSEAVRLRDEAHALMVDRMRNPKSYDMNGRRLDDGIADDLSEQDLYALARRLGPVMGVGVPDNYLAGRVDPTLSQSRPATETAPPSRGDSRRPHYKQARDAAAGIQARDAAWAGMVSRMTGGRSR